MRCPKDAILVKIEKKFSDKTDGGLFIDETWNPGQYATVTGKVIGTPLALSNHFQKKHLIQEVKEGDELAFSYSVIYNRNYIDNKEEVFSEQPLNTPWVTVWKNQDDYYIVRKNLKGGKFSASYFKKEREEVEVISEFAGNSKQVNDWIDNIKINRNDFLVYKNMVWDGSEEYWRVDYLSAYAVKRGEKIVPINGYVLLEVPKGGVKRQAYTGNLEIYGDYRVKEDKELRSKVLYIGNPLKNQPKMSLKAGETVSVNKDYAQEYRFWGKDYLLVRQDQILCKVA